MSVAHAFCSRQGTHGRPGLYAGVAAVILGVLIATRLADGVLVSRFELVGFAFFFSLAVLPMWITTAIPFVALRRWIGPRGFSYPLRSACMGLLIGLLTIPFGVEMSRVLDFDGVYFPYYVDLSRTAYNRWAFYALAGVVGGLIYWAVEFSTAGPQALAWWRDPQPWRLAGGTARRRAYVVIAVLALVSVAAPAARWWFRPHVHTSASLPDVSFVREWWLADRVGSIGWPRRASGLTTRSGSHVSMWDAMEAAIVHERFPHTAADAAVTNGRKMVVPDGINSRSAFSVIDLETGQLVHDEPDPVPDKAGKPGAGVRLAMSPDGEQVAVAYDNPREGQPVSVYSTEHWVRTATFPVASKPGLGTRAVAFSPDGGRLAAGAWPNLVVLDSRTGVIAATIPVYASVLAFSPDGTLIAAASSSFGPGHTMAMTVHVYRLPDGREVGSSDARGSWTSGALVWDPLGRFIAFVDGGAAVRLWTPLVPGDNGAVIDTRPSPRALAMSPGGTCLAVGNDDHVSLFQVGGAGGAIGQPHGCDLP